jgi:hypothetical protein
MLILAHFPPLFFKVMHPAISKLEAQPADL